MLNFSHKEIKQGNFVNFGAYGSFYVCRIDESFGITDKKEDRNNKFAAQWSISKSFASNIIEKY